MKMFVASVILTFITLLANCTSALECPKFPEQAKKDWEVNVTAEVAKIGPLKGAELKTTTSNVTKDLLGKLPDAGRIYLEQMMFATYCTALRDDKLLTDNEKSKRLKDYICEVRKVTRTQYSAKPKGKPSAKREQVNHPAQTPATNNSSISLNMITVIAEDMKKEPVKDICFSFLNVGTVSLPTTPDGRTEVAISEDLRPGQSAELQVSRSKSKQKDWVIYEVV